MNSSGSESLYEALYEELRSRAANYMRREGPGHTLQPTALVHEAYLKVHHRLDASHLDRSDVLAVAAKAMQQLLIDSSRRKQTQKRRGTRVDILLESIPHNKPVSEEDLVAISVALQRMESRSGKFERQARVFRSVFIGGLSAPETAELIGISRKQVDRDLGFAKTWLAKELVD